MEGDRWAHLAKWAQAHGAIDFGELNPRDPRDTLFELHILRTVEAGLQFELLKMQHTLHAAATGFIPPGDEAGEQAVEQFNAARNVYVEAGRRFLPYLDWPEPLDGKINDDKVGWYRQVWQNLFGKIDTPEMSAKFAKLNEPAPGAGLSVAEARRRVRPGERLPTDTKWLQPEMGN